MNRLFVFFSTCVVGLLLAGFLLSIQRPREQRHDFRVGLIAPLHGDYAEYGREIQRGVELAVERLKQEHSIVLKVYAEDACVPAEGVPAAKKLLTLNGIHALVGSYCMASMVPNVPLFERQEIFAFQSSVVPDSLLNRPFILSTYPSIAEEARQLAALAFDDLQARRVGILHLQTPWGEEFTSHFSNRFEELGGKVAARASNPIGVNDFRSEITALAAAEPDLLFFVHVGRTLGVALKQARSRGLSQPILAPDEAEAEEVLEVAGDTAEGMIFLSPESSGENPTVDAFRRSYEATFGSAASLLAAHSFDATMLTATALQQCKAEAACMRSVLQKEQQIAGASGTFRLRADGSSARQFVVKEVRDGRFVPQQRQRSTRVRAEKPGA